ncbi:hypothetical protein Clacol_010059 [Clathrus columnatus]|uniref:Peroxidase n=1 Tax=Clathrus columnatus TaxID=1419009 RepID=A0AAV5AMB3_9AGAM|nr:hypothetical protein Clacol_010059 [Clathrus columnatus]
MSKSFVVLLGFATAVYAANFRRVACPDGNMATNAACCPFLALKDDLQANLFKGQCGEDVHEVVRLTFTGRPNATAPAPDGLVPQPQDSATSILVRFADAGFAPSKVIALLAAHSIGRADHVDPTLDAAPFDTTPFTFDTQFFLEVLLQGVGFPGTDNNIDPITACTWQGFVNNQKHMSNSFVAAMAKLAVTGQGTRRLIDCSEVLPPPTPPVNKPATFPATKSRQDVQQACLGVPFPHLSTDHGAQETIIPHCPGGLDVTCAS